MKASKCVVLLLGLILTLLLDPIAGRKGFGGGSHSYPKSHSGLSGGGHGHGYPSSGGLSGSGGKTHGGSSQSHGYPSGGGLSGGGSGQSHGYPSGGLSGGGSSQNHGYPSGGLSGSGSQSHGYPSGHATSKPIGSGGTHSYPSGNGGLSGSGHNYPSRPAQTPHSYPTYKNYHYNPPQQIHYTTSHGSVQNYPVYHGTPPTYVYQYRDSGSKYGTLLTGLALLNLGTLAGTAYAIHKAGDNHQYKPQPGEICKFAVKKENGDYEETKIDCQIISSFIYQDLAQQAAAKNVSQTVTTTVTNSTVITNNGVPQAVPATTPPPQANNNVQFVMLPNGTLVDAKNIMFLPGVNVTQNATQNATALNATLNANNVTHTSVVTTTVTNTTVVNALDVKGKPVEVTGGMQCSVIRISPTHTMKKSVPCGLLVSYSDQSIKRNSAIRNGPAFTVLAAAVAYCVAF